MNATQLQLLSVKYQDKEKLRQLRVEDKYTNIQNGKTAHLQVLTDIWAGEQPDKP